MGPLNNTKQPTLQAVYSLRWRQYQASAVTPNKYHPEILQELHAGSVSGHLGEYKTCNTLQQRFYWPGLTRDVKIWCRTCPSCAAQKTPSPNKHAPLQTIRAGAPMQIVTVDILGPLPKGPTGNSYVLVAMNYFTKWAELYAVPNQEAATIAAKLTDEMFLRCSPPEQLHSDQGRQFESKLMADVRSLLGIRKSRTTPYHPQSDGLVERYNRTLLNMLATCTQDHPATWEDHLRRVCMAYNTSMHPTTGYSPFFTIAS